MLGNVAFVPIPAAGGNRERSFGRNAKIGKAVIRYALAIIFSLKAVVLRLEWLMSERTCRFNAEVTGAAGIQGVSELLCVRRDEIGEVTYRL